MEYDVLIVGGGPAGKSKSALTLLFSRLENHIKTLPASHICLTTIERSK